MTDWLTLNINSDEWTDEMTTIAVKAAALMYSGDAQFNFTYEQTKQITQAQIEYCVNNGVDLSGILGNPYFIILPIAIANSNVPVGFPDRTYIDENEQVIVRKIKDYVANYRVSQDGLTALVRCTHKPTNEDTCGISLTVDEFILWLNAARNQSVHTEIAGQYLIELDQALTLLEGDYAIPE